MNEERKCEGCFFYIGDKFCAHESVAFMTDKERKDKHPRACGPSGRYWEPKEESHAPE